MQGQLILRDGGPGDLEQVADLLVSAYAEYREVFPAEIWRSYRRELGAVGDRLDAAQLVVAVDGAQVVGTATFYPNAAQDGHAWPPGVASLRLLAVRPGARSSGVGRALVDECVRRARRAGARDLGLHTAPFMRAANRLYAACGFVRAPELDFDAEVHYAGAAMPAGRLAGEAFLLPLEPAHRAAVER